MQMTDNDPMRLLRDFINARRDAAQLFANDIVATAQEQAAEKYPSEDLNEFWRPFHTDAPRPFLPIKPSLRPKRGATVKECTFSDHE